ncbi:hypothetical protein CMQ_7275 [Grosmannia clavigera kw1407]|uniref:Uncharacterized protein n=1 Tax=Grosmannia clavigera (strain kw1407 / UAMH 11150) TaxID=655863 RepID=F0XQ64_GROCL|nr:uncharacterized protein CMQ_7275 [Grosmannia clavigera kw1407]EFX00273.1 hypothetical protein CMQ_7275 [Grosmannia clavigera kw1407]
MAMKTTVADGVRRSLRRRHKMQMLSTLKMRKPKSATILAAARKAKNERRQATKKQQQQQHEGAGAFGCFAASPGSTTSTCEHPKTPMADIHAQTLSLPQAGNTDGQHYIFGRYFDENDRSAADILATLYYSGVLDGKSPASSCPGIRGVSGSPPLSPRSALAISGDSVKVCDVALPSMRQTSIMLKNWHAESQKTRGISTVDIVHDDNTDDIGSMDVDPDMDGEADSTYPSTPELSSGGSSARSSFSTEPASGHWNSLFKVSDASKTCKTPFPMSPYSLVSRGISPASLPPPAYTAAELNTASEQKTAPTSSTVTTASPYSVLQKQPFSTYEPSYFSSETRSSTADRGMPSPPQSPTYSGRRTEYCFRTGHVASPPPTYEAAMQQQKQQQQQQTTPSFQQTSVQQPPFQQYQFQNYHQQQQQHLPSPHDAFAASASTSTLRPTDNIATTVVTLPSAGFSRGPPTPISPLAGPHNLYNTHSHQTLPAAATLMAPTMGATPGADSSKKERQLSRTGGLSGRKSGDTSVPRPHCNVKYETAELDFIMYQRCTKNRAWDDVTASFNAALPRLRQYAEMDYLRMSGANGVMGNPVGTPDAKAVMDRYRPRPERTTPGLQASYYRQRLALPLLDEAGRLVFDKQTGKQIFTEVMVRDDKSRKKMRRLNNGVGVAGSNAGSSSVSASHTAGKDDARVHLVLYFPERVAHYDYWFVTAEDKALARQRAYDRNMQRAQRGLAAWHPGSDDPETGILIRNKE